MSEETNIPEPDESTCGVGLAAEALERARAELEKAQAFYESVRQQAAERLQTVRNASIGDALECTMRTVKRHPGAGLTIAALLGFFLGRLFRR